MLLTSLAMMAAMLTPLTAIAGPPPGAGATGSIMCLCDNSSRKQQWNFSSLGNASFVTNSLAESEGLAACLGVFSDQDPRHAVEGSAVTMYDCTTPRPIHAPAGYRQWVVKTETEQLMWASPETGGSHKGGALCLTAFPGTETGGPVAGDLSSSASPPPPPLGVWPCTQRNSTRFPDWQTFKLIVGKSGPFFSLSSPSWGGMCVSWAGEDDTC
jgi:hypothetical protein